MCQRRRWWVLLGAVIAACAVLIPAAPAYAGPTVCPNGVIVYAPPCPVVPQTGVTGKMSGVFTPAAGTATTTTSVCPTGTVVWQMYRYADPYNGYTGGVQLICEPPSGGALSYAYPYVIGRSSGTVGVSACPAGSGNIVFGFSGRAGEVIDGFQPACGSSLSLGVYLGGSGGTYTGPYGCPVGMYLTRLTGTAAPFYGGYDIISLQGGCATPWGVSAGLGSAPLGTARVYRASDAWGPVRFTLLVSTAQGGPHAGSHYYAVQDLVVATRCSRSTKVPGAAVMPARRGVSERPQFGWRRGGFRVDGRLSGSLERPQVHATVKVLKGRCRGEVVSFTAVKSRPQG